MCRRWLASLTIVWALLVAGCFAQTADDSIVVVGNQAQPVQWTHQGSIQSAILRAGPHGVVWIPATYPGTDCSPLSSCAPGSTLIIDLRGGLFQTYPALAAGIADPGANGVLKRTGLNLSGI